jgi:anaerobic selenocysteine-containing dehydrogenase
MPLLQRSTCPYDCPDACGLLVETDGDTVLSVRGDPDHGYTHGALCPKVNGYERTVHAAGRLRTPLLRTGPKGSGAFRPVSWEEAVALIASRWQALVASHGRESILPVTYAGTMGLVQRNAQHPLFHRLGASLLDRTICTPAQDAGWAQVMGTTPGPDPEDAARSDLVLLWGSNALATNIHFLSQVRAARRAGGQAFLIDTYRQPTAPQVDRVFLVRPGSDGALALGVLHLLARQGLLDRPFLEANTVGWADLEREVLPAFTPAHVAGLTGLGVAELEQLAQAYGRARAPFIRLGGGLSRYGNGALTTRALLCLPAAVGAWAKPGGGLLGSTGTGAAFDLRSLTREDLLPGPTRHVNLNRLGHALTELDGPRVMSIYVSHCNPAAVCPDQNAVLRGLAREDLFTVVHERFLTDTAAYADVVLPAPTMLETADLYRSYGQFFVQRVRPVIPPVGESKSNWETVRLLAKALGFSDEVFSRSADEHIDAILARPSAWLEGLDREGLDAGRPVRLAPPRGRWLTRSGRIELRNDALPEPLPVFRPPHSDLEPDGLPLRLQTAPSLHRLNSSFTEREELSAKLGPQTLQLGPADAAARGLRDGQAVTAFNALGEVAFVLRVTDAVPPGVAVAEGVHSLLAGNARNVNALTSQRLTDSGGGSTFYDNRVEVRG